MDLLVERVTDQLERSAYHLTKSLSIYWSPSKEKVVEQIHVSRP